MASPVGHLLAGQVSYRLAGEAGGARDARLGWLCAFPSIAADLDFLPGLVLGTPARYHQGASHSLLAAAALSLVLAASYGARNGRFWVAWLALLLAYLSHLGLDLLGPDRRPPFGLPLLWPFNEKPYLSPITIFSGVRHAGRTGVPTAEWLSNTLSISNLVGVLREALILGPILLWLEFRARRSESGVRRFGG